MVYQPKYDYLNDDEELKNVINEHIKLGSLVEIKESDLANIKLNLSKAENELKHAEAIFKISFNADLKRELELLDTDTFYSGVISHAYYAIFFAAKALLIREKITTKSPNIHKATLDAFSYYFILSGKLDMELLLLYKSAILKADALLSLFVSEKEKRAEFTYKTLPDANKIPAKESLDNANKFLIHIKKIALS
jgi:uncharacterized protein (UPF0332 family)